MKKLWGFFAVPGHESRVIAEVAVPNEDEATSRPAMFVDKVQAVDGGAIFETNRGLEMLLRRDFIPADSSIPFEPLASLGVLRGWQFFDFRRHIRQAMANVAMRIDQFFPTRHAKQALLQFLLRNYQT
jgi:hypothetical protein